MRLKFSTELGNGHPRTPKYDLQLILFLPALNQNHLLKTIIKEGDELERIQEALQKETDQLKENTKEIVADVSYPLLMFFGYKSSVEVIMMMFTIKLD